MGQGRGCGVLCQLLLCHLTPLKPPLCREGLDCGSLGVFRLYSQATPRTSLPTRGAVCRRSRCNGEGSRKPGSVCAWPARPQGSWGLRPGLRLPHCPVQRKEGQPSPHCTIHTAPPRELVWPCKSSLTSHTTARACNPLPAFPPIPHSRAPFWRAIPLQAAWGHSGLS